MKNLKLSFCALALMAVTSVPAMAESVELAVKGTIIPAACVPSITGEIKYPNVTAAQLSDTDYTVLDIKEVDFAIACSAEVRVAVSVLNNKPGTVAGGSSMLSDASQKSPVDLLGMVKPQVAGLGVDEGDNNIGGYAVGLVASGLSADGQGLRIRSSFSGGKGWYIPGGDIVSLFVAVSSYRAIHSWTASSTPSAGPVAIKDLTGKLAVQAYLNKKSELDTSKAIQLNGLTTIELVYL